VSKRVVSREKECFGSDSCAEMGRSTQNCIQHYGEGTGKVNTCYEILYLPFRDSSLKSTEDPILFWQIVVRVPSTAIKKDGMRKLYRDCVPMQYKKFSI
jgi:hypothetical protein